MEGARLTSAVHLLRRGAVLGAPDAIDAEVEAVSFVVNAFAEDIAER